MTIEFAVPPEQSLQALQKGMNRLLENASVQSNMHFLSSGAKNAAQPLLAHPVYSIQPDQLATDGSLASIKPTSWRYLIKSDLAPTFAEVNIKPDGHIHNFAHFNTGTVSKSTLAAIQKLSNDSIPNGPHELRMLRIVDLNFAALWLAGKPAENDIFIPLEGANLELDARKAYSRQGLFAALDTPIEIARIPGSKTSS